MKIKNIKNRYIYVGLVCVGLVIGYLFHGYGNTRKVHCNNFFHYLNPHLACQDKPVINKSVYLNFEAKLNTYLDSEKKSGRLLDAGVYFRDLENGPTFGINSSKLFISASLIKLPTIMTVFRLSEQNSKFLQKKILYSNKISSDNQDFTPDEQLEIGHYYTIEDLISRSLEYSDNAANELLVNELYGISPNEDLILNTFNDLGLIVPGDVAKGDLSTKTYSSLLRLLYNASFLSKENSEKILNILDKAAFKEGLESGVPAGTRVSSKFGERELDFVTSDGKSTGHLNELHDCGIIYYPENPYLLCVMTKGKDFKTLAKIISNVSKMVYEEVDSRRF